MGENAADEILNVSQEGSKVVRIIPAPTCQFFKVILEDELQSINIIVEDGPYDFRLLSRVDPKVVFIEIQFS